jgi:hypothetical protein
MNNKKILLAPIMGSVVSVFIFIVYLMSTVNYQTTSVINAIFSLLSLLPLMLVVFTLISYIACTIIGVPLIHIKNKYLLSYNFFWLLALLSFFALGCISGIINYTSEKNIAKSLAIFLSFTLGGLFSSSLYSVLNGDVKPK